MPLRGDVDEQNAGVGICHLLFEEATGIRHVVNVEHDEPVELRHILVRAPAVLHARRVLGFLHVADHEDERGQLALQVVGLILVARVVRIAYLVDDGLYVCVARYSFEVFLCARTARRKDSLLIVKH